MTTLIGTEKQVAFASKVRDDVIASWRTAHKNVVAALEAHQSEGGSQAVSDAASKIISHLSEMISSLEVTEKASEILDARLIGPSQWARITINLKIREFLIDKGIGKNDALDAADSFNYLMADA
jgi:hypothetical protein